MLLPFLNPVPQPAKPAPRMQNVFAFLLVVLWFLIFLFVNSHKGSKSVPVIHFRPAQIPSGCFQFIHQTILQYEKKYTLFFCGISGNYI